MATTGRVDWGGGGPETQVAGQGSSCCNCSSVRIHFQPQGSPLLSALLLHIAHKGWHGGSTLPLAGESSTSPRQGTHGGFETSAGGQCCPGHRILASAEQAASSRGLGTDFIYFSSAGIAAPKMTVEEADSYPGKTVTYYKVTRKVFRLLGFGEKTVRTVWAGIQLLQ